MRIAGEDMMRRRKALAEHPFGTLKCRAGYRHFLVRGFAKVRGEWSLMALCYNFSRVLRIVGLDRWRALLAQRAAKPLGWLIVALVKVVSPRQPPRCRAVASVPQFTRVLHLDIQHYVGIRRSGLTCPASKSGSALMSATCTTPPSSATRAATLPRPGTNLRWRMLAQYSGSAALIELVT